jgi:hypothetical protein
MLLFEDGQTDGLDFAKSQFLKPVSEQKRFYVRGWEGVGGGVTGVKGRKS